MRNQKVLKINDALSEKEPNLIQAISRIKYNRLKIKKFVFLTDNSVKKVSTGKHTTWKPPCIRDEGKRKYIECYVRVPDNLPEELQRTYEPPGCWHRFRIFKDINRVNDDDYNELLLSKLRTNLENGYTPFDEEADEFRKIKAMIAEEEKAKKPLVTINAAYDNFLAKYHEKSKEFYAAPLNLLKKYLTANIALEDSPWYQSIELLTQDDIKDFMIYGSGEKAWAPNTYNDKVSKLKTFFRFCVEEKYMVENPALILKKATKGTTVKHTPFEDEIIADVKKEMLKIPRWGKHLHDFCEVVYYSCTRPDKETRQLQIKDVLWGRKVLYISNEKAKGGNGRPIFMVAELEELFNRMKLKSYPADYYIFGKDGPPGPEPTSEAHYSTLFRKEVREPNNLAPELTNYSWKHTRVIHLYLAGARLAAIQQLCGHSKPSMTEEYLSKGLGLKMGNITHDISKSF